MEKYNNNIKLQILSQFIKPYEMAETEEIDFLKT